MPDNRQIETTSPGQPRPDVFNLPPDQQRRGAWRRLGAVVLLIGGASLLGLLVRTVLVSVTQPEQTEPAGGVAITAEDPLHFMQRLSAASQRLAAGIQRAVVRVEAEDIHVDARDDEIAQLFGAPPPAFGQGSGVIVEADGYLLTNYHVVRGAGQISVIVEGSRRLPATVVGHDALTDLAVLKIEASGLETITWSSYELPVGAFVWAIGSPFGLEGSVSFGIVSARNRDSLAGSPFQTFLQTDAAVNPGNSGGPLIDAQGRVVGINTAILGQAYQGISFAIPSQTAREIYQRLKQQGKVARGWLGVTLAPLNAQRAAQLNLKPRQGIYVVAVDRDSGTPSPAGQAGIRPGDVLTHWNGQPVDDPIQFSRIVAQSPIGSQADVTLLRNGTELQRTVVVGQRK